jgi:hypothetical protein
MDKIHPEISTLISLANLFLEDLKLALSCKNWAFTGKVKEY